MTTRLMQEAALAYLRRGWSVIPIEARGKRPLVRWEEFQHRRAAASEVKAWFRKWPGANVGIIVGAISGLVVLDIDAAHGGAESLARLEAEHGRLPSTIAAATGGGGTHVYFRHPGGTMHNRVGLAPGIDLRGDGGYVVAPPSIHPSGQPYRWRRGASPEEAELAAMPAWLMRLAGGGARVGHPLAHWRKLVREGVDEGARNNSIASLAGHLLWHGVDPAVALDLLLCWNRVRCRPPLSEDEVAGVVDSITSLHLRAQGAGGTPGKGPS